jgi:2-polyprenyl-3-methyl-5-hydroxy-6-metoxy-1,4-benzoquinol methylase
MPDFSRRSNDLEIMDDLHSSGEIIDVTLKELETINKWLGGNHVTVDGVKKLLDRFNDKASRVMIADLGCGSGDILRLLESSLSNKNLQLEFLGIDANPNIVKYAVEHTDRKNIFFETGNIFSDEFRRKKFDIVIATLFFHHFSDQELISFFANLKERVRMGIVINDIHRHWFAYYSIKWLTGWFSKSMMVKNDAPLSVMRAFKREELENILRKAGISNFSIKWMWAFRWQVIIDVRPR